MKSSLRTRVFSGKHAFRSSFGVTILSRAFTLRMSMALYLQERKDGVCISLKVRPRASRNEIAGLIGNELKVKVTAPPVDSAANEAVLELLSGTLGCARNQLELLCGATSRRKQILIRGLTATQIEQKLR